MDETRCQILSVRAHSTRVTLDHRIKTYKLIRRKFVPYVLSTTELPSYWYGTATSVAIRATKSLTLRIRSIM